MLNLDVLNPQQRLAVEAIRGPVLILAGAGTGKTRVITYRIAHMIEEGVAPGKILAVTFTNKAAREMKERVSKLIRRPSRDEGKRDGPTICTFHSLGVRILRQHIEALGYKKNFTIYDESDQLSTVKKILSHLSIKRETVDPAAILASISKAKNRGTVSVIGSLDPTEGLAEHVRPKYDAALQSCNAVDFDDLLVLTMRLFEEHPAVLEACRQRYRYVMVDEYQDTNAAQFRLVHLLTEQHRNLCVVGDDDQSIYGWRGAEVANLLDLERHFPEVKIIKLEQNYRSTNSILAAANAVIKNNPRRRGKQLWSHNGEGARIALNTFQTDEEEARSVVEQIEFARHSRRATWGEHAILFRTNLQSRPLELALRHAKVRYHLIGGQSYFDRREIKDVLAYLKTMINPHDEASLLRIANVPARGLGDTTLQHLLAASQERRCTVYTAMRHTDVQAQLAPRARESLRAFIQLIDEARATFQSQPQLPAAPWWDEFFRQIGYFDEVRRGEKDAEAGDNRVRNIQELLASLDSDQLRMSEGAIPGSIIERMEAFLEEITLDREREEDRESAGDAVTLITMHSCKGLEFPHVFVVGLEDGLLPHSRSKVEGTLDEERRLFYVARTRAMKTLTLSHCLGRKKYGAIVPCHVSPFLIELPPDLVERGEDKARKPVPPEKGVDSFAAMRAAAG